MDFCILLLGKEIEGLMILHPKRSLEKCGEQNSAYEIFIFFQVLCIQVGHSCVCSLNLSNLLTYTPFLILNTSGIHVTY